MIVMPANTTGIRVGYVAHRYEHAPSRLGHLFSPGPGRTGPHSFMPYALDNGAFSAFTDRQEWGWWHDEEWFELLNWAVNSGQRPMWALCPDVVGDRDGTLRLWDWHHRMLAAYGWPMAFAAQDGMSFGDVPSEAAVVFLGGSTAWKWSSLTAWCAHFPRVHVGRVNGLRGLRLCAAAGAESCDGTGFGKAIKQWRELEAFLAEQNGERAPDDQTSLSFDASEGVTAPGSRSSAIATPARAGGGRR